jgi:hypothetical protein
MNEPRFGVALAAVNGKLYAIGGSNGSSAVSTVEKYDPFLDTWTYVSSMMNSRSDLAVAVVNSKIYAIGGQYNTIVRDYVEEYDDATNLWVNKRMMPLACYGFGLAVCNSRIYAIGGATGGGVTQLVNVYDPATDSWAAAPNMSKIRYGIGADTANNKIYAVGGWGYADPGNPTAAYLSIVEEGEIVTSSVPTATFFGTSVIPSTAIGNIGQGKLVVSPNVLDRNNPTSILAFSVRGTPGRSVSVYIYNAAGRVIDDFDVSLDSNGYGTNWYVGPHNSPLAPGVYWAKAYGNGVNDRKSFMVVKHQ